MKCLVLVCLLAAVLAEEPISTFNYHKNIGVPLARGIRQREEAKDFDGARIVGGSPAPLGVHPHLGGLLITLITGETTVCGSSLLSNTRAVTAAHCWWDGVIQARTFTVVFGSPTLFSGGTRVTTTDVRMHGSWNPYNANNDVAVIRFGWVGYTNIIQPVALASGSINFVGSWATVAGFGRTSESAPIGGNQVQSHVTVQVINNAGCVLTYGPQVVIASTLCTSGVGGVGICGGDSGGPLTTGSGNSRRLIGIASFNAFAGCQMGLPSGFARVSSFESWIVSHL